MSLYDGDYIRVLTPETTDGVNLKYRDGRQIMRESHLAFNNMAIKSLEEENARRPDHLKHKIEIVRG